MTSKDLHTTIYELEEDTWRALKKSGAAMVPYITRDCVMQFPMGLKLTETTEPSVQDILYSESFIPWKSFKLSKVDVTPVGANGAVISYMARATRPPTEGDDSDVEFEALCSSVWRLEGEEWNMCFHQQTLTA